MPDDFLSARFPEHVCDLADALTHQDGENYAAFIRRACSAPSVRLIKEAEIADNYGRLHFLEDEAMRERLKTKYETALSLLTEWASG